IMRDLVRTSPMAVTGTIDSYGYDREKKIFTLEYTQDKEFDLPTEIFLHAQPKKITADGEYVTEGKILKLKTGTGKHKIVIEY
ncbi:MAG: hypothetical protein MJ125_05445, partial [Clostridia bacterium]|nr:hypothetical protein [Clostridia bacterium]